ncbi:MAG: 4Fe-4S binding protein [Pseudomonadota bacterium]
MTLASPEIHALRCVRYRYRYSACRRCADACPFDAIALTDAGVQVDPARCRNCALCTSACRTGALMPPNLARIDILKRCLGRARVIFACAPSGAAADEHVPCLGALDAAMLAYLGKRGIEVELRGTVHCAECPQGEVGAQALAAHLEGRAALQDAHPGEQWTALLVGDEEKGVSRRHRDFQPGRRQLFRRLVGRGVDQALEAATPPQASPEAQAIRAGAWHLPEMRELLQIVCQDNGATARPVPAHSSLPLGHMRLEGACTACEACFRVCPTGAIQIREDDATWQLAFSPDRCVGCGVCLEACQPRALAAAERIPPDGGEVVWRRLAKQRCSRCDRYFVSTVPASTCPVCADDEDAFGAIFGRE